MNNALLTFGPNEAGRDFVIGDLHGSLTCYENLIKHLQFDPSKDRMFSVGDLVDRGPDSLGTLGLLRHPWFHATLANHEQMMLEAFNGGYMGQYWYQNGGQWGMETRNVARAMEKKKNGTLEQAPIVTESDVELLDLLNLVEKLPFLITVNHKNGKKFHILHAELPPVKYEVTDHVLADSTQVQQLAVKQTEDGDAFLWARNQFMTFYKADLSNRDKLLRTARYHDLAAPYNDNLSHIISGHTIVQQPFTLIGQTNIDTCAYASYYPEHQRPKWAALTCICLDDWTFVQATETEFRVCEPFVINKEDLR